MHYGRDSHTVNSVSNYMNCPIKEETGRKTAVRKHHYMCVRTVKLPVMA